MPITTFDVPEQLLKSIDSLIARGYSKSRKDIVVRALNYYLKYEMYEWRNELILFRRFRRSFLTQRGLELIVADMNDDELYQAGKRMGLILRDSMLANENMDSMKPENYERAFALLQNTGLGSFSLSGDKIVVSRPYLPKHLLHGYLETGLGVKLRYVPTTEDLAIYSMSRGKYAKVTARS
jgi:Arc/MetJ-type ribon-helix-helix transcriptional regulator